MMLGILGLPNVSTGTQIQVLRVVHILNSRAISPAFLPPILRRNVT